LVLAKARSAAVKLGSGPFALRPPPANDGDGGSIMSGKESGDAQSKTVLKSARPQSLR
jgi:hypothetical protein